MEFHQILQTHWYPQDEHLLIEKYGLGANSVRVIALCYSLSMAFWFFLNILNMQWWNFIKVCEHIDIYKMNICIRIERAKGQFC